MTHVSKVGGGVGARGCPSPCLRAQEPALSRATIVTPVLAALGAGVLVFPFLPFRPEDLGALGHTVCSVHRSGPAGMQPDSHSA